MPKAFPLFDIRYDPKKWFESFAVRHLKRLFGARLNAERSMSYSQLRTFDQQILRHLEMKNMKRAMEEEFYKEREAFEQEFGDARRPIETEGSTIAEKMRLDDYKKEEELMKLVKNKNLIYRRLAYEMAQIKRKEDQPEYRQVLLFTTVDQV